MTSFLQEEIPVLSFKDVMGQLKKYGTAQNVKIYRRHGARGDLYGVSFANLGKLKKQIKIDHELAVTLWKSGNVDAMTLATMIADPQSLTLAEADRWVRDIDYYLLADLFGGMMAKSSFAFKKIKKWTRSKNEYIRQSGYSLLSSALKDGVDISDAECRAILKVIEKEIHDSPNRARHAMNNAVIAIGVFRRELSDDALKSAGRIGKVNVDHGDTSCKTPDAVSYIQKALSRGK